MVNTTINPSLSNIRPGITPASTNTQRSLVFTDGNSSASTEVNDTDSTVSTLANHLNRAASRAETRDSGLLKTDLRAKHVTLLKQITGGKYLANKVKHDAEVPRTKDPERLATARQATQFINGSDHNPFKGMFRDQLTLITYDDSTFFTLNERRAAWEEACHQEAIWRNNAVRLAISEYDIPKMSRFFKSVLEHFDGLPRKEQVQYPGDYATRLKEIINLDLNSLEFKSEDKLNNLNQSIRQSVVPGVHLLKPLIYSSTYMAVQSSSIASARPDTTGSSNLHSTYSGRDLMVLRLYGGKEPGVANGEQGMSVNNISRASVEFLSKDDRVLLAEMYEHAQKEGAHLAYVDNLAIELGDYRQHANGRLLSDFNDGTNFDLAGHQLTVSFTAKDAAIAARILSGSSINSTRLDQGFLRHLLNPGYGALGNTSSLAFLEQMVTKFSGEGAGQSSLSARFSTYLPVLSIKDNSVMTASKDVKLKPFEPDIVNVDGVQHVTSKGKAAGITLDRSLCAPGLRNFFVSSQELNSDFLDALLGNQVQLNARTDWLSSVFKFFYRMRSNRKVT